jgi:hypothetical protein
VIEVAAAEEKIPEYGDDKNTKQTNSEKQNSPDGSKERAEKQNKVNEMLDLTIEIMDRDGDRVAFPITRFMRISPVLKSRFTKFKGEGSIYGKPYEQALQTVEIPMENIVTEFPEFDPGDLKQIRFVFDRTGEGVIILDNIGISSAGPLVK